MTEKRYRVRVKTGIPYIEVGYIVDRTSNQRTTRWVKFPSNDKPECLKTGHATIRDAIESEINWAAQACMAHTHQKADPWLLIKIATRINRLVSKMEKHGLRVRPR